MDVTRLASACVGALERVIRSLVRDFADVAWLDVVTEKGLVRVASAAHDGPAARALEVANDCASSPGARNHHDMLHALRAHTFLREPLIAADEVVGALTVAALRPNVRFGQREQRTVELVARGVAYLVAKNGLR